MHHQASQPFLIDFAVVEHNKIAFQTIHQADRSVFLQHSASKKLKHQFELICFNTNAYWLLLFSFSIFFGGKQQFYSNISIEIRMEGV